MNTTRHHLLCLAISMAFGSTVAAASPHYLSLVNDAPDTIRAFEVRPAGVEQWKAIDVGDQRASSDLHAGVSVQIALRDGCAYDFRVTFTDNRSFTVIGFNACKTATLHAGRAFRTAIARSREG